MWGFHRETDWATQDFPDVAAQLHRCDELAVRASAVLKSVRQRICLQLVFASASHLLGLVDARAGNSGEAAITGAVAKERAAIDKAEAYYHEAANGQAQMAYFGGMAMVTAVLTLFAAVYLALSWATPVAALIAGAVGAVVSVVQRINSGKFELETDVGGYPCFLGGLRPLIGGAFAMVISFAFTGGLLAPARRRGREHRPPATRPARARVLRRLQRALGAGHAHLDRSRGEACSGATECPLTPTCCGSTTSRRPICCGRSRTCGSSCSRSCRR